MLCLNLRRSVVAHEVTTLSCLFQTFLMCVLHSERRSTVSMLSVILLGNDQSCTLQNSLRLSLGRSVFSGGMGIDAGNKGNCRASLSRPLCVVVKSEIKPLLSLKPRVGASTNRKWFANLKCVPGTLSMPCAETVTSEVYICPVGMASNDRLKFAAPPQPCPLEAAAVGAPVCALRRKRLEGTV